MSELKIWIMNHYAGSMYVDKGGRHYSFCKYLKRLGHEPIVFCSNAKHDSNAEQYYTDAHLWHLHLAEEINTPYIFIKSRPYANNGKARVMNMIDFFRNVKKAAKELTRQYGSPDIIYASSVHPLTLVAGIQLAKKYKVKCICEVRDLWPESLIDYGMVSKSSLIVFILRRLEKWIYTHANSLIFTMEGGYDYIIDQGWDKAIPRSKVFHINNGVDLEAFDYNAKNYTYEDIDIDNKNIYKVIYTGSIRKANGSLLMLPEVAAELARKGRSDIEILIFGTGDYVDHFMSICEEKGINNLVYKGFVKKYLIPCILHKGDVNLLNCYSTAIGKYGSSQNKLFEYLASGKPILSGEDDKYSIISNRNCGISKHFDNASEIADAIIYLVDHKNDYPHIREVGEEYDYKILTHKLLRIMEA